MQLPENKHTKKPPTIIFLCVENACRSQMAEGFAHALGGEKVEALSAGSKPSGKINPRATQFMKEKGIDISSHRSKGFDELAPIQFDCAVTMGCGEECPLVPKARIISWDIPDPKNLSDSEFRDVRDEIERKVTELLKQIGIF